MTEDPQNTPPDQPGESTGSPTWRNKAGRRLMRVHFVSDAVATQADLSAFKQPPTLRIISGVFAICLSFVICWPAISALGAFSIYVQRPWIVMIGGPMLYGLSHACFILGMFLSGEKYMRLFFKWAARVGVEKLLAGDPEFSVAQIP